MTPVTDLIRNFYRVLDKCNTELCEKTEHYLFVGIEVLKETANNCSADICNLKAMRIKIPDAPSSHTKPANSADIEIYFEAEIKWTQVANTISYPIHINRFNVIVIATSNNAMISWHLDNDGEQDNKYLHQKHGTPI